MPRPSRDLSSSFDSQSPLTLGASAGHEPAPDGFAGKDQDADPVVARRWLRRKRALSLGLIAAVLAAMVTTIGILSSEIHSLRHPPHSSSESSGECLTPECIDASAVLMDGANLSADPCQDFYAYACGGFVDRHYMPHGRGGASQFTIATRDNDMVILQSLEEGGPTEGHGGRALAKARKYYQQCMDTKAMDARGVSPILDLLTIPDFLVDVDNSSANFTKEEVVFGAIRELQQRHLRIFTDFYVGEDRLSGNETMVNVRQGILGLLDASYYRRPGKNDTEAVTKRNAAILQAYKALLWKGLRLLETRTAHSVSTFSAKGSGDEVEAVVAFETRLAGCHSPKENLQDPRQTHNPMPVEEAEEIFPLGWRTFLAGMPGGPSNYTGRINVETPDALRCVTRVLGETPMEVIALYMKIVILLHRAEILDKDLRQWKYQFNLETTGNSGHGPRWRQCMDLVQSYQRFGFAITKAYTEHRGFGEEGRREVISMFEGVERAFLDTLPEVGWMEPDTKTYAAEKARRMKKHLGYPEWAMDDVQVERYFEDVEVEDGKFYENTVALMGDHQRRNFEDLPSGDRPRRGRGGHRWGMSPTEVNAYYSPTKNSMNFPAGILNPPFYTTGAPLALNYGSLGAFIGHEFLHGFDSTGRKYGADGTLRDWWTEREEAEYERLTSCFVGQYERFEVAGHRVDGEVTLGENIADNGGAALAWRAWKRAGGGSGGGNVLPGSPWTAEQVFWVGFGQNFCTVESEEMAIHSLKDEHSPSRFRVQGVTANSEAFAKAFGCPVPKEPCILFG